MPLSLDAPDGTLLPGSPLDLVVFQVQHDERPEAANAEAALQIHEALGGANGTFARFETIQQQELNVGFPGGMAGVSEPRAVGHRFVSVAGDWTAAVSTNAISLETTRYPGWDEFRQRCRQLLETTASIAPPVVQQRVGLRYIDRVSDPEAKTALDWNGRIVPELIGLVAHPVLGPAVVNARHQTVLDLGESYACILNQALLPSPDQSRLDYVLDFDLYLQIGQRFEVGNVLGVLDVLHGDAAKLFHLSVEPAQMSRFRS
jgi:uncharacterized protein (TIGR04255 family)